MSVQIKGLKKLMARLSNLEKKAAKRANRKAIRAGTAILKQAVKVSTPVDEGLLKKAQTSKVIGKGSNLGGIVGADVEKLKADSDDSAGQRPVNIDWLVEYGHVAPNGTFIPPSGYMRRAQAEAMPKAEAAYIAKLKQEIEREATR
jgi:HK97 gp10 family phage protein